MPFKKCFSVVSNLAMVTLILSGIFLPSIPSIADDNNIIMNPRPATYLRLTLSSL
jgi:hypothetical protein